MMSEYNPEAPPFWEQRRGTGPITDWLRRRDIIRANYRPFYTRKVDSNPYPQMAPGCKRKGFKVTTENYCRNCRDISRFGYFTTGVNTKW